MILGFQVKLLLN